MGRKRGFLNLFKRPELTEWREHKKTNYICFILSSTTAHENNLSSGLHNITAEYLLGFLPSNDDK